MVSANVGKDLPAMERRRRSFAATARWLRQGVGWLALLAGMAVLFILTWVYFCQEKLLFDPEPLADGVQVAGDGVRELRIRVDDATISVLHLQLPNPRGVVVFLHGNRGNLATWFTGGDLYRRANYDLVMPDYRGYGRSSGRIESEEQLRSDVAAVWQAVAAQYRGKRVVVYGRSLGSALAAGLAAQIQPHLTILVSPYCSMAERIRLDRARAARRDLTVCWTSPARRMREAQKIGF